MLAVHSWFSKPRYCGKLSGLYPKDDDWAAAKIDEIIDTATDITVIIIISITVIIITSIIDTILSIITFIYTLIVPNPYVGW